MLHNCYQYNALYSPLPSAKGVGNFFIRVCPSVILSTMGKVPYDHYASRIVLECFLVQFCRHSLFEFSRNGQGWYIFVLLKFENKSDVVVSHIHFISKYCDK